MNERPGFTLLEILISLLILGIALTATSQLMSQGVRAGVRQEAESEAARRCRIKLDEILSGVETLRTVVEGRFPDDGAWTWSIEVQPTSAPQLQLVTVTVKKDSVAVLDRTDTGIACTMTRAIRPASIRANSGGRK